MFYHSHKDGEFSKLLGFNDNKRWNFDVETQALEVNMGPDIAK